MEFNDIELNIRRKYKDAETLKNNNGYANSIYLSGYCVELALKYAIAKHMNWPKFYSDNQYKFLKVHDLKFLISLTGIESEVKMMSEWHIVQKWNESTRYSDPNESNVDDAQIMLTAVKNIVEHLLCTNL